MSQTQYIEENKRLIVTNSLQSLVISKNNNQYEYNEDSSELLEEAVIYIKAKGGYLSSNNLVAKDYIKKYALGENKNPTVQCTLLIGPPGSGKSTWLKNHQYDIFFDDMSVLVNPLKQLENKLKPKVSIAIADINFCDISILKKAWQKIIAIGQSKNINIEFTHVLFIGEKANYVKNVEKRNDGRNVEPSINRFVPYIHKLASEQLLGSKMIIDIKNYDLKPGQMLKR